MDRIILIVGGHAVTWGEAVLALLGGAVLGLLWLALAAGRASRERSLEAAGAMERQRELDEKLAALTQIQSETTGRMQTIGEVFGNRQADLVRLIAERL